MSTTQNFDSMSDCEIRILGNDTPTAPAPPEQPATRPDDEEMPEMVEHAAGCDCSSIETMDVVDAASAAGSPATPSLAAAPSPAAASAAAPSASVSTPSSAGGSPAHHRNWTQWFLGAAVAGAVGAGVFWGVSRCSHADETANAVEAAGPVAVEECASVETIEEEPMAGPTFTTVSDTMVNDVALRTYSPIGGHMELYLGNRPDTIPGVICAVQAADVRADADIPAGAFIVNGTLIARGHSKLGFCAIIGDSVSIGRQAETPLFERAIESSGSFFRQYSLVSNGQLIDINPKGKSFRRALCLTDGNIVVVETEGRESYHDFSQALADIGASEALALVGGDAIIYWREKNAQLQKKGAEYAPHKYSNFVVWRE